MIGPRWLFVAGLVAGLVASTALAARRLIVVVRVHGESMVPTYTAGDTLLAMRYRRLERGSAVVFRMPHSTPEPPYRIKRIIAVPGDPTPDWVYGQAGGAPVPPGRLVVRGDGPSSEDSRHYGYVHQRDVLAVVLRRPT